MRRVQATDYSRNPKTNLRQISNNPSRLSSQFSMNATGNSDPLGLSTNDTSSASFQKSYQNLIEHANDVRSQEWFKVHHHFRIKLNQILSEGNSSLISEKINDLWQEFLAEFEIAELDLQECSESARNSLVKEEFSHLLKLSSELIKRKARLQALKVIHDELTGLVSPASNSNKINLSTLNDAYTNPNVSFNNVIPLRRKAAN